ncbi:MAG: hypothetical protein HN929_01115 [Chloroflexi bacterium]|nr:hypothetical protein [Chloroflexota bacterium]MBT7080064.1 hypothetical protein [Chloroflexota bacterium]MBT7289773.1 hypothetical protein [Chloroflexota bacterium]
MSGDVIVAFCAVCGKEIKRGKTSARKYEEDGLWACGFGCIGKYKKERNKWNAVELVKLKERQISYDLLVESGLTQEWADKSYIEDLPQEAKDLIGDEKILGICKGVYGLRKLRKQIIATSTRIVIFDPKLTGVFKQVIPYEQVISAQYSKAKC